MKPVIIDAEAEDELAGSIDFYEGRAPGLGLDFERAAREFVQMIQASPQLQPLRRDETRRFLMDRFPFVIHYVELPESIWILAFAHTSRRPGYWRKRF